MKFDEVTRSPEHDLVPVSEAQALADALTRAREYLFKMHASIAAANYNDESPVKPDLKMIDEALDQFNKRKGE
jgi:hypothetical protein